ncbi:MAG: adenylate/guanylate cyclase domain-containing protein [Rhizobiaceae bacterium]|nr:adenylate/guanylate cyclase domain-containing protein [Rhizobiaceae bacterium]
MAGPSAPLPALSRRGLQVGALALAASLAVSLLAQLPGWRQVELTGFDYLSTLSPPPVPADAPVIVAIDESSFAELQRQWPWPRSLHARLVESLRAAGAKAIGLDIIFAEPSADPAADAALAAALGPDVVLAGDETLIETPQADQVVRVEPLPEFTERGARAGIASIVLDGDGTLRRLPRYDDGFARVLAETAGITVAAPAAGTLIQAFGPARTLPTVSYYQALDPAEFLPEGTFRDRVVIVGLSMQSAPTAESGGADAYSTSWTRRSGRLVSGAEIQATVLSNLASGLAIRSAPGWLGVASTLAAALLAAFAVWRGTGWWTGAIVLAAVAVMALAGYLLIREGGIFVPVFAPAAAFVLVAAGQAGVDYAAERRARRAITRAFSQYLSPVLVERLAADPSQLKLGGERRTLSILFCDVRGFTTISEQMKSEPERLTRLINRLLGPLSQVVLDRGGTIDKYIGDCIMAFWNAPLDDPDHAVHAVDAALAMIGALDELNRDLAAEAASEGRTHLPLHVGIGINTGDCVVGNMGSEFRFDYSALGDAVNLASRLEGQTKVYGVPLLIGAATARLVGDRHTVAEIDSVRVKGKNDAETVSTVLPTADADALATHAALIADARAGRAGPGDRRVDELQLRLPWLADFYDGLRERLARPAGSA